jgi:MFS family permease
MTFGIYLYSVFGPRCTAARRVLIPRMLARPAWRQRGSLLAMTRAGVGVATVAAPLYGAELAPSALRGRFVSAYQLAITAGIFITYLVDGWLSKSDTWRWMLGASAVPGLLLLGVALVAPESPRWLMKMKPAESAQRTQQGAPRCCCRAAGRCDRAEPARMPKVIEVVRAFLARNPPAT